MANRVCRFMVSLTVQIGLWFMAFFLCLVTVFVVTPIVLMLLTLSVAVNKLKSIIKKGKRMAKNLIVTITGYAGEIKQGKAGEYVVVPVPVNRKNDAGQWEVVEKHYFNIALESGHSVEKDQFYEVIGELRISKWTNDKGETQVSFWVSKASFKKLATVAKSGGARENLEAFGAVEAPF